MKNARWLHLALGCAVCVFEGVCSEPGQWFNGNPGGPSAGGAWSEPLPAGATHGDTRYVLENVEDPLAFYATAAKAPNLYTNLVFRSNVLFDLPWEELPEIDQRKKGAVIAYVKTADATNYYVLARDPDANPATNRWIDTGIAAVIGTPVALMAVVTNGVSGTCVTYSFGDRSYGPIAVAVDGAWSRVSYTGNGEVSALTGDWRENWIPPEGKSVPAAAREAVEAWAKRNSVPVDRFADTATDSQGRTRYESCMLNLAPDEALVAMADVARVGDTLGVAVRPPLPGVGSKVVYTLVEGDAQLAQNNTGTFDVTPGEGRKVYSVQASVDGAPAGRPSKVGVQSAAVGATGGYLPVPWTDYLKADAKVTDLIKTSGLKANDQIDVFNPSDSSWTTCQYDGTKWEAANGAVIPTVKRGQAFRFTPHGGGAGTLYLVGGADAVDVTSTTVVPNAMNLVAKPDGTAFALSKLGANDKARVYDGKTGLPSTTYFSFHGTWYRKTFDDGKSVMVTEIPAGQGFFLQSESNAINW